VIPVGLVAQQQQVATFTVLYAFPVSTDGAGPVVSFGDNAGNLYGAASRGGPLICFNHQCFPACQGLGCGVIFKLDMAGNETVLHDFTGADGRYPSVLLRDTAGDLYGTTFLGGSTGCGGNGCGVIFKLDTTGKETILHNFGASAGGWFPSGTLLRDSAGNFYGTTVEGGDLACHDGGGTGCGVVFKLNTAGKETVLHTFSGADGAVPTAGLVADNLGNLYGTTVAGGDLTCPSGDPALVGCGVVFKLDSTGRETVLHRFTGSVGGGYPVSLLRDTAGNLYGMTHSGGSTVCPGGCGLVFKLTTTGTETVLHRFIGVDGRAPFGGLLRDAAGNLYGTTSFGGQACSKAPAGCGVVFKLDAKGKETVIHRLTGGADGWYPVAGLFQDAAGNVYGTTSYGGRLTCSNGTGCGVIFKLIP